MQEFPCTLLERENINLLLYKPIHSTQRIKYTCFDVSLNYIILGSTSGSVYIFNREPCTFQQLIPLSEGSVSHVSISPDEKTIALSTTHGTVCLITLKPTAKLIATSSEHSYDRITCFCWNDNSSEVYIGDEVGKVSTIVLSIFSVNGMFQSPLCTLMNLDSSIVQLNFSQNLLLVSTLTRCYVCDTIQEQYKQIGNKSRNGVFGACFFKAQIQESKCDTIPQRKEESFKKKSSFSFISENSNNTVEDNYIKIFCARPGSRLWETSTNGIVLKTHQFKETLGVAPTAIYKQNASEPILKKYSDQFWPTQSLNFPCLFVIAEKYLFSYTTNGLYILDPLSSTIVLWNNELTNIYMASIIRNKLYLMTRDCEFYCLILDSIDTLILNFFNNKQYYDCLQICIEYKSQLLELMNSEQIDVITNIINNHEGLQSNEILELLRPLISILQSNFKKSPIKLESGIVVVNSDNYNLYSNNNESYKLTNQCESENLNYIKAASVPIAVKIIDPEEGNSSINKSKINQMTNYIEKSLKSDSIESNLCKNLMERLQTDLEPIYALANNINVSMNEEKIEEILLKIETNINSIKYEYKARNEFENVINEVIKSAELFYFTALLKNTSMQILCHTSNEYIKKQFVKAFVNINIWDYKECTCKFPYPIDQLKEPKFLDIGQTLLRKFANENKEQCIYMCNRVPYMWREYLIFYMKEYTVNDILCECLQTKDNIVLSILLPALDKKQWKYVIVCFREMSDGKCISCGRLISEKSTHGSLIDWIGIATEIMKKDGPDIAMMFLTKLKGVIPESLFDRSIFQSLIFTKILYHHGMKCAVNFNKNNTETSKYSTMCSTKIRNQLIDVLEKDLRRSINKNIFGIGAHHWGMLYQFKSAVCPCCTLSLQTPILLGKNGIAIFSCGHIYHVNCMIEKKLTKCNLHT